MSYIYQARICGTIDAGHRFPIERCSAPVGSGAGPDNDFRMFRPGNLQLTLTVLAHSADVVQIKEENILIDGERKKLYFLFIPSSVGPFTDLNRVPKTIEAIHTSFWDLVIDTRHHVIVSKSHDFLIFMLTALRHPPHHPLTSNAELSIGQSVVVYDPTGDRLHTDAKVKGLPKDTNKVTVRLGRLTKKLPTSLVIKPR